MKAFLFCLALCLVQMNTLQGKEVVHLLPNRAAIDPAFGGKRLELLGAPESVYLPPVPPKRDLQGNPWNLDVKNMGPRPVTLVGKPNISILIIVNQTIHIQSNGLAYSQRW